MAVRGFLHGAECMQPITPAIALLALTLAACTAERTPAAAAPADNANALANHPAAPPPPHHPAEAGPPQTAPGHSHHAPAPRLGRQHATGAIRPRSTPHHTKHAWRCEP